MEMRSSSWLLAKASSSGRRAMRLLVLGDDLAQHPGRVAGPAAFTRSMVASV